MLGNNNFGLLFPLVFLREYNLLLMLIEPVLRKAPTKFEFRPSSIYGKRCKRWLVISVMLRVYELYILVNNRFPLFMRRIKMKPLRILIIPIFFIIALQTSCTSRKPASEVILTPTKATIIGRVNTTYTGSVTPLTNTVVRLAKVFWNADKTDGAFVLEGASSPSAITNQKGEFVFENIDPADYVIVVGEAEGDNEIIAKPNGEAKIYTVEPDIALDVGTLTVKLRHNQ
jgi:hypothetical protein